MKKSSNPGEAEAAAFAAKCGWERSTPPAPAPSARPSLKAVLQDASARHLAEMQASFAAETAAQQDKEAAAGRGKWRSAEAEAAAWAAASGWTRPA